MYGSPIIAILLIAGNILVRAIPKVEDDALTTKEEFPGLYFFSFLRIANSRVYELPNQVFKITISSFENCEFKFLKITTMRVFENSEFEYLRTTNSSY